MTIYDDDYELPQPFVTSPLHAKPRPLWLWFKRGVVLAFFAATFAAGYIVWKARSVPRHWTEHQAYLATTTPEERHAMAQRVEERLLRLIEDDARDAVGPNDNVDDPDAAARELVSPLAGLGARDDDGKAEQPAEWVRKLQLSEAEINAWVLERFHDWLDYRGYVMPKGITDPMVKLEDESLVMAFAYRLDSIEQVFSMRFSVEFKDDGLAVLDLHQVFAGELKIPQDAIGATLRKMAPDNDDVAKASRWLDKLSHLEFKPTMKLPNKRKAQVLAYHLNSDGLELTVRIRRLDLKRDLSPTSAIATVPTDVPPEKTP